jgi:hypothetical protein
MLPASVTGELTQLDYRGDGTLHRLHVDCQAFALVIEIEPAPEPWPPLPVSTERYLVTEMIQRPRVTISREVG